VKTLTLAIALALGMPALAQDKAPPPKKKPAAKQVAHKKPTPEQLRKFDQLEKKQEAKKSGSGREPTERGREPK
jgi:hypothetical protein